MEHKMKNLKTFESSISGVFSFNSPEGKEKVTGDTVIVGDDYDLYQGLDDLNKLSKEIMGLDPDALNLVIKGQEEWMKENLIEAVEKLKEIYIFVQERYDEEPKGKKLSKEKSETPKDEEDE